MTDGWSCSTCGAENDHEDDACEQCGRVDLEPAECPENHDDWRDYKANYCPYCGILL